MKGEIMMDSQYLKSQAIITRKQQEREYKKNKKRVRVTKCYLVQVIDSEDNEVACEYVFANSKEEAMQRGKELKSMC